MSMSFPVCASARDSGPLPGTPTGGPRRMSPAGSPPLPVKWGCLSRKAARRQACPRPSGVWRLRFPVVRDRARGQGALRPNDCSLIQVRAAPVAQLDRALPSEGRGHRFESCRVRQSPRRKRPPTRSHGLPFPVQAACDAVRLSFVPYRLRHCRHTWARRERAHPISARRGVQAGDRAGAQGNPSRLLRPLPRRVRAPPLDAGARWKSSAACCSPAWPNGSSHGLIGCSCCASPRAGRADRESPLPPRMPPTPHPSASPQTGRDGARCGVELPPGVAARPSRRIIRACHHADRDAGRASRPAGRGATTRAAADTQDPAPAAASPGAPSRTPEGAGPRAPRPGSARSPQECERGGTTACAPRGPSARPLRANALPAA